MENQKEEVNVFAEMDEHKKDEVQQAVNSIAQENKEEVEQFDDSENDTFDFNEFNDKKYERVLLNDKEVTIVEAQLHMPKQRDEWKPTLKKNHLKIDCGLEVKFDTENEDREFYSGFMVLKDLNEQDDETKPIPARYKKTGELRKPTCDQNGQSQVAELLRKYKTYLLEKGIDSKVVEKEHGWNSLFKHLNSKPKVLIKTLPVKNPITGKDVQKNFIEKFL